MVTHSGRRLPTPYASAAATAPWGCTLGPAVGLTLRTISKALRTQSSLWLGLRILHAEMLLRARRILRHATHRKWHRLSGQRSFLMRYASTCKAAERSDGRADAHASVPCVRCVALRCVACVSRRRRRVRCAPTRQSGSCLAGSAPGHARPVRVRGQPPRSQPLGRSGHKAPQGGAYSSNRQT
jgi:hypothetical protein